jgi:hypothetical protein
LRDAIGRRLEGICKMLFMDVFFELKFEGRRKPAPVELYLAALAASGRVQFPRRKLTKKISLELTMRIS